MIEQHRQDQILLARTMVAEMSPLWGILDVHDLRGTTADWLRAVRPVVEKGFLASAFVAAEFVKDYRAAKPGLKPLQSPVSVPNPFGPFGVVSPAPRDVQLKIMVSLQVTGPGWVMKNSTPGADPGDLMRRGFSKMSGAATRIALNGGRGMVRTLLDADEQAIGIRSVAGPDSCESCKRLAGMTLLKGVHSKRQLDTVAVGHDHCLCVSHLVYE